MNTISKQMLLILVVAGISGSGVFAKHKLSPYSIWIEKNYPKDSTSQFQELIQIIRYGKHTPFSGGRQVNRLMKATNTDVFMMIDENNNTLLHWAVIRGMLPFVKALVDQGGAGLIMKENIFGKTPLDIARTQGNQEIIIYLEEKQEEL